MEYLITGDAEEFKGCLVQVCGTSHEGAEEDLNRMLNNPTENDKRITKGLKNFRIEEIEDDRCWWNRHCD